MHIIFYILSFITVLFTLFTIIQKNPIYSLLFLISSLLSTSGIFFVFGSSFAASLEIIIYAGAIMVLFLFVIMLLNLNSNIESVSEKWIYKIYDNKSVVFALLLFLIFSFSVYNIKNNFLMTYIFESKKIGECLFGHLFIIVELASILLLNALIVTLHFLRVKKNVITTKK
ncbi:NADH-quinone oxidoreductase subunit J [Buchnera aphidicola (Thelaxes suberi)]|uniref:NADH-quinone oxidoreductase subunit J family protein n=1 Tax=Buchnera aphidicola TaxID=9 RepID=UPI003464B172